MALRLIITQGPRQGETLEFPPGSAVRVGRLVRGNDLAIRDSGISSNHLRFESESDSGKWVLRDLDSSNGTFLNGDPVEPDSAVEIRSGDVVKLGERTSISVEISAFAAAEPGQPRRNPRRGLARRARVSSYREEEEEGSPEASVVGEGFGSKRSSGREAIPVARRARRAKNEGNTVAGSALGRIPEDSELGDGGEEVPAPAAAKKAKTRKNLQQKPAERVLIDIKEESEAEADVRANAAADRIENESSNGVEKGGGLGSKQGSDGVGKELNLEKIDITEESEAGADVRANVATDRIENESSDGVEKGGGLGSKQGSDGVGKELNLEKMTLGEWFDYLEVDFRKQIFEATEEMIKGMRLKAERVREYVVQQKNEKGKVVVV